MATVYDRVKTIVVDKLGVDEAEVEEGSSFVDNLNADSLDLVELIMAFEEEFSTGDEQLEISDDEAGALGTIKDAVDYLKSHGIQDASYRAASGKRACFSEWIPVPLLSWTPPGGVSYGRNFVCAERSVSVAIISSENPVAGTSPSPLIKSIIGSVRESESNFLAA